MFPTLSFADTAEAALVGADAVLVLTEWPEFVAADPRALGELVHQRIVIDGRNCLDAAAWRGAGWTLSSLGRPDAAKAESWSTGVLVRSAA